MCSKRQLGKDLKAILTNPHYISRIAKWAEGIYYGSFENVDAELRHTLRILSFMDAGPEFVYSKNELEELAQKLIDDELSQMGETKLPLAEIGDEKWLICPICIDAWETVIQQRISECPKCESLLRNPRHVK